MEEILKLHPLIGKAGTSRPICKSFPGASFPLNRPAIGAFVFISRRYSCLGLRAMSPTEPQPQSAPRLKASCHRRGLKATREE